MISSLDDSKSDETWDQNSWMIQGSDQQLGDFSQCTQFFRIPPEKMDVLQVPRVRWPSWIIADVLVGFWVDLWLYIIQYDIYIYIWIFLWMF